MSAAEVIRTLTVTPDQVPEEWSYGAETYDRWFAPLTRQFADDAVEALDVRPGQRFLDVAAGTGALACAAAEAGAVVLAVDFSPGMLAVLERSVAERRLDVTARRMDGHALAVPDGAFDAGGSVFGLMFFVDLLAGARELVRAVRTGGRVALVVWSEAGFPFSELVFGSLRHVAPGSVPGPDVSMRLGHPQVLARLLDDAGCRDVDVRAVTHDWPLDDPKAFFRSIPLWSRPLRPLFQRLSEQEINAGADACAEVVDRLSGGTGRLACTALLGSATR
jgi:SAM-dependent methyltransferase